MDVPRPAAFTLPADDGGIGGLTVVFLHALGGAATQWAQQLAHMRTARRAIAITLRGHPGAPAPRRRDFRMATLAADVLHTLDALGVERCALVGHSIGAHVALSIAACEPQRIAGILLADPASDARGLPHGEWDALVRALESDAYTATIDRHYRHLLVGSRPAVAQRVLADLHATAASTVVGVMHAARDFDALAALATYRGRKLAVDSYLGEQPGSLHHRCPDLRRMRLGDCGHWLHLDRPAEFNLILDGWLGAMNPVRRDPASTAH
jgi:pimeloyl-ACP methyl ester carboxylesterase